MNRRWYHIRTWECIGAGMYDDGPGRQSSEECRAAYACFLSDSKQFHDALNRVLNEWPVSCEQFLSNEHINRIAWLGQASMCIATGIPAKHRGGFHLLSDDKQRNANRMAQVALDQWLASQSPFDEWKWNFSSDPKPLHGVRRKIRWYFAWWGQRGYADGIPESVPSYVAEKNFAPSYRAICEAILQNDIALESLGFTVPYSEFYGYYKAIELSARTL